MSKLLQTSFNTSSKPIARIVGGEGAYLILDDGRKVIDGSNTGGPLGHRHPEMLKVLEKAIQLPVVNDGWFWSEREDAAQDLVDTAFTGEDSWVGGVRFCLSGGEANDLALTLSQAITGRTPVATRERAYHGMVGLSRSVTVQPQWHGGLSSHSGGIQPAPNTVPVRKLPNPVGAVYGGETKDSINLLKNAEETLKDTAATIIDYTQGGIYYDAEYQNRVAEAAKNTGSLWIADEVVTGLGRYGDWFSFQGADSRPDIVTLGKPLAGGASGAGAIVLSKKLLDRIGEQSWRTYSTFRGHPIMIAAIRAHLRIVKQEGLIEKTAEREGWMKEQLISIAEKHPSVARVDGRGMHWTIELVGPSWKEWKADTNISPIATKVTQKALEYGALIGTSGEQTSMFIAPPLTISDDEIAQLLDALDKGLDFADKIISEQDE